MNLEQVGLQLGIAGVLMVLVFKAIMAFIKRWGAVEDKRTAVLETNLAAIVTQVQTHAIADLQSHTELAERVARFEGKLDEIVNHQERHTPVEGVPVRKVAGVYSMRQSTKNEGDG